MRSRPPFLVSLPPQGDTHALIRGFDLVDRVWIEHCRDPRSHVPLPRLEGRLLIDRASQLRATNDSWRNGNAPIAAMLIPGSVEDIIRMIRFCDEHGIVMTNLGAAADPDQQPMLRVRVDAPGGQRPRLRVVGSD